MERKRKGRYGIRPVYIGFFITLFTAAVIMNLVYMAYYSYSARKLAETERSRILGQTVFYINRYRKEVEDGANMLSISSSVQKLMTYRIHKNYLDYAEGMEMLAEYAMTIPGIYRIDLYVRSNQTLLTSYEGVYYDLNEEEKKSYEEYMDTGENWFWDIRYSGKEPKLVSQTRNARYITFLKPVFSRYTGKKSGVLCISIYLSELEAMIPMENSGREGIQITCQGEPLFEAFPLSDGMESLSQTSDYSRMTFDYYYPDRIRVGNNGGLFLAILAITAFFGVIFFSIVEISERKMFYPVKTLLCGFKEVEKGRFDIRLDQNRKDLFREIFDSFNHMAKTLEAMIEELSNERTRRNEFKFRLLQMQIKPHFLYNLFNNMIWMLEQKDYGRLEILIQSTAGYYKTALNFGSQDIMLAVNKKQLEYYTEIQKIRFGDIFAFKVTIPVEVEDLSIPNLLLQPLVENAIVHGLKGREEEISHISVRADTKGGMLVLSVEDDGCGMEQEVLEDIQQEMENYEGDGSRYFALVNITARLHNRYKGRALIRIESIPGKGTRVTIQIPLEEVRSCTV
ncbi:histidine kinase [Lachnospiraceae bacterium 54-53]